MADGAGIICRPRPIQCKTGDVISFRLLSDLHIGAANVDYDLIKSELEDARKHNARIAFNGDVFDLILPKDHKRFSPDVLHPCLLGRRDVIDEAVNMAYKMLLPYVDLIDMIGIGNHETSVEKYHSTDVVMRLLEKLQDKAKHQIYYGGYLGYLDYRIVTTRGKTPRGSQYKIFYFHGGGGSAPITKGMIDFSRLQMWVSDAHVVWIGHKHNRLTSHVQSIRCPDDGDQFVMKDVLHIMTGAYFETYGGQSQDSIKNTGRRSNYAADYGMAPQGKGGFRIDLHMNSKDFRQQVVG